MLLALPRRMSASLAFLGAAGLAFALLLGSGLLPASIEDRLTDFTSQFTSFDVRGVQVSAGNYSIIERLAHWQAAQNMILDQPVLGVGFGNYEAAYDQHRALNWPIALGHAHNIYLNVWAETGVVGFAAHIALWITVVAVTLRAARSREVGSRRSQVGSRTLSLGFRLSASDFSTSLAIGLLGAWAHLAVHSLFDSLYVANIYLVIGAFLGLLAGASQPAPSSDLRLPASTFQPLTSHEH
jgi:O-antigen ligase